MTQIMDFVAVPAGTFWMGVNKEQCTVAAFQIGIYPVTQGQWEAVMGNNPSHFSRHGGGKSRVQDVSDEDLRAFPVESVSWEDTQEFIRKLNEKDRGSGWLYRLPRDAEWEYACRGGATSKKGCSFRFYAGEPSNSLDLTRANFNARWPASNRARGPHLDRTTKVGSYPGNVLGIFDMHGNVWEWCEEEYEGRTRIIRGGCWFARGSDSRASLRRGESATWKSCGIGLRVVRS